MLAISRLGDNLPRADREGNKTNDFYSSNFPIFAFFEFSEIVKTLPIVRLRSSGGASVWFLFVYKSILVFSVAVEVEGDVKRNASISMSRLG